MMSLPVPLTLALGLLTPWFAAAGGALVSIPIIIHILNKRRFKIVEWAAMEFLLQAMRKNRRRLKFEEILLLAIRCLVLALLGLALARPMGCDQSALSHLAGQQTGLHIFVLDNSLSMAYEVNRPQAKTHLDQARLVVREMISRLTPGGEAGVIITTASPASSAAVANYDLDALRSTVDRVEQSHAATDMPGALRLALKIARENKNQPRKVLYIIGDQTRSAWEVPQMQEEGKTLAADLAREYTQCLKFNVAKPDQWNNAVLDLKSSTNLVTTRFGADFLATVRGYVTGQGHSSLLQWRLNDLVLPGGETFTPDAVSQPRVQPGVSFKQGGPSVLTVRLDDEEKLRVDNTRSRVVDVVSELKVLIVEGFRGSGVLSGSGSFLELALSPLKEPGSGPRGEDPTKRSTSYVSPELISDLELSNKVLSDYRCVILTNVAQVTQTQAGQLKKFVEQGGSLIYFMGDQVNPAQYNQSLLPAGLLPGRLISRKDLQNGKEVHLDFKPKSVGHPMLEAFRNEENTGLNTARIGSYIQVELDPKVGAERVLSYVTEGDPTLADPAVTFQGLGKGRVVFVSTTADPEWSSLPAKLVYTAFVHEMLGASLSVGDAWMNLTAGSALEVPASLRLGSVPVLKDPQKREIPLEGLTRPDGSVTYRSKPLVKSGIYELSTGPRAYPIAVNTPAEESDIRVLPDDRIKAILPGLPMQSFAESAPPLGQVSSLGNDFGWMLMLCVLLLLASECFLAMFFGHWRLSTAKGSVASRTA